MALLKKLFGKKDPEVSLREAFLRHEWAEVVRLADDCGPAADDGDLQTMISEARSTLVELNLQEARTRFSQGDFVAGREHAELAKGYGASAEQLQDLGMFDQAQAEVQVRVKADTSHSCTSCGEDRVVDEDPETIEADWELLLAGLPDSIVEAYMAKSDEFRMALSKSYEGQDAAACDLFQSCREDDQDAHYFYEYGSALCRAGRYDEGLEQLFSVVKAMPSHRLAWELLLDLDATGTKVSGISKKLLNLIETPDMKGFAAAALAKLAWKAGDGNLLLEYGDVALIAGEAGPDVLQMMASVLESRGDFQRAESMLSKLPSGGCGGGAHPALAEFWLRRKSNLDLSLEAFKNASRQESDNPRWLLRIAQTYLAKGWRRDGLKLLNQLSSVEDIAPELGNEVKSSLDSALRDT